MHHLCAYITLTHQQRTLLSYYIYFCSTVFFFFFLKNNIALYLYLVLCFQRLLSLHRSIFVLVAMPLPFIVNTRHLLKLLVLALAFNFKLLPSPALLIAYTYYYYGL